MLVPVRGELWDDLLTSGRVIHPTDSADVADEVPGDYGVDASEVLRSMRDLER
jgi:hypothetical protein